MLNLNGMLSIVMPAYNEEKLIYHSIMETLRIVEKFVPELEIIAVNDGSKDNTKAEIERAIKQDSRVRMVSSEKNRGKGDNKDVVIGCKFLKDSKLDYPFKRKVISMGYYIMLLVLFHLNVKDTQTGLKVFRVEAIKPVAHLIRTSGFAYDIELLVAIHRRGFSIAQMPVEVVYVRDSGVKRIGMKDIWQAFCDTWAIFGRVYFKHYYD